MKILQVTATSANFASGVLKLEPEQARSRAHALEDLGDGYFEILSPVSFKRGEIVGFDGEVNKALLTEVEATDEESGNKDPKAVLDGMTKKELVAYAKENFDVDLNESDLKADLVSAIEKLAEAE